VLVEGGAISGVFDWGCAAYGDHLYDLAWCMFWAPWHPNLDIPLLREMLERRWREVSYWPHNLTARLSVCSLHIGLDHLAYNAFREDWPSLEATAERMRALAGGD
jgi:hygromycin-B 4-O-kinase